MLLQLLSTGFRSIGSNFVVFIITSSLESSPTPSFSEAARVHASTSTRNDAEFSAPRARLQQQARAHDRAKQSGTSYHGTVATRSRSTYLIAAAHSNPRPQQPAAAVACRARPLQCKERQLFLKSRVPAVTAVVQGQIHSVVDKNATAASQGTSKPSFRNSANEPSRFAALTTYR